MAKEVEPFCENNMVNALGGCCGSCPEHIAAIVAMASAYPPRKKHAVDPLMRLSGLEPFIYEQCALSHNTLCTLYPYHCVLEMRHGAACRMHQCPRGLHYAS